MTTAAKKEPPTRHGPVAYGRGPESKRARAEAGQHESPSETRLQVAVGRESRVDERDIYADVPCTD